MVLVCTIVFTLIVTAVASLVTTGLRYGHVVEDRADRLAAADGGLRYGIERLRNLGDLCTTAAGTGGGFTKIFPPEINGATTEVTCRRVGSPISDIQGWGAVITGANVPGRQPVSYRRVPVERRPTTSRPFAARSTSADPTSLDFQAKLIIEDGDLWYSQDSCEVFPAIPEVDTGYLEFNPALPPRPGLRGMNHGTSSFTSPTRNLPTAQALSAPFPSTT